MMMARIGSTAADMERTALGITHKIAERDTAGAVKEAAALQARYQELRNAVGDLNQLVAHGQDLELSTRAMRWSSSGANTST